MSEDNLYLLFCYTIYGLTLAFYAIKSKSRTKTIFINLTILFLYSSIFIYNLIFNSAGGSGLVWLVYLMFVIGLHWLFNLIGLIWIFISTPKPKEDKNYTLNNAQDFWNLFDQLIELLKKDHQTDIISKLKNSQKHVNGMTDGWYEFKIAFEKALIASRPNMTKEQNRLADFLLESLNKSFK